MWLEKSAEGIVGEGNELRFDGDGLTITEGPNLR